MDEQIPRWKLTAEEKARLITHCPKCNSENLNPAGGPNSANGYVKCYDCGHGPFWWLLVDALEDVDPITEEDLEA